MILVGVDLGEGIILRRPLRKGPTTEVMNMGMETLVVEANNRWRNRDKVRRGGKWLSIVATYTQVENALGLHLI